MKIKSIKYGKRKGRPDVDFGTSPVPKKVTVELTLAEATYLSKLLGKQSWNTAEDAAPGMNSGIITSNVYYGLCEVLNASFSDGDTDAVSYLAKLNK